MITDNYIKMCEMAEEIQNSWKPEIHDWCTDPDGDYSILYSIGDAMRKNPTRWNKWLPTLEQLFEMVGDYRKQIDRPFLSLMVMKKCKYKSMQELILCTAMEIKYNKYWNGEKWEAIA